MPWGHHPKAKYFMKKVRLIYVILAYLIVREARGQSVTNLDATTDTNWSSIVIPKLNNNNGVIVGRLNANAASISNLMAAVTNFDGEAVTNNQMGVTLGGTFSGVVTGAAITNAVFNVPNGAAMLTNGSSGTEIVLQLQSPDGSKIYLHMGNPVTGVSAVTATTTP